MLYIFFCSISVFLGLIFYKNKQKSVLFFLLFSLLTPLNPQFMFITSLQGVYFYDFYFLVLLIYYLLNINFIKLKNIIFKNRLFFLTGCILTLYYIYLCYLNATPIDKYLLRDLRPILLFIYGFLCIQLFKDIHLNIKSLLNILLCGIFLKIIFFIIIFILDPFQDPYYQNFLWRYRDAITFISALFLIVFFYKHKEISLAIIKPIQIAIIVLSMLMVLISNLRILLFALVCIYIFSKYDVSGLFKKIVISIIFIISFLTYSYLAPLIQYNLHTKEKIAMKIEKLEERKQKAPNNKSIPKEIEKKKSKLNQGFLADRYNSLYNNLGKQMYKRFSPALAHIKEMNFLECMVGKGFSTTFNRNYFNYRGLDTKHNCIDSTYLTFFVKYGFLGLLLFLFTFFKLLLFNVHNNALKFSLIIFYLILFFSSTPFFHSGTILHLVFINLFILTFVKEKDIV